MPPASNFFIRHITAIGIVAVSILVIMMATLFTRQAALLSHSKNMVVHSYEVTTHIQMLFNKIKDAEIGQRSYILTGNPDDLEPYNDAISDEEIPNFPSTSLAQHNSIHEEIAILKQLTADNAMSQRNLNELDGLVDRLLKQLDHSIRLRKTPAARLTMHDSDFGSDKDLMNNIRRVVGALQSEENRLLLVRIQDDEISTKNNNQVAFTGIVLFYIGMLISVRLATQHWKLARQMESNIYRQSQEIAAAHKQLNESHVFLKNIINNVADPIFVKDRQHRWIEGNTALWSLMGKPETELLGKSDYDFFPKDQADVFWEKDEEVFTSGKVNLNIENFTDARGVTHIISTKKACFKGPGGELTLVGVIHDITDIRTMEAKLQESDEARLKSIMNHSGRPVYIKDLQGKYLQVNKSLLALVGLEEKDMVGKTDYDFFPKECADTFRMHDRRVIESGMGIECEEIAPHPDGPHTYISVKFPLYDASGKIYAICGISTDITDRKLAEARLLDYTKQLQGSNRELARSNQELDDFAYIASHDLKEPLRGLFNHAAFLLEDYKDRLDNDGVGRLNRLAQLCQRMEHLINDLLYFSRLGRSNLAVQEIDPAVVVLEITQMMEAFIKENNAHIIIPHPMPHVICDRPRITEVFRNLITNAIKYNDKPEKIVEVGFLESIETSGGTQHNVFYVKDNGIGIDAEFHEEIFRIFRKLHIQEGEEESGTGVGLTFVKKIIERHNGHIWLASEEGKGSTFYFTLGKTAL